MFRNLVVVEHVVGVFGTTNVDGFAGGGYVRIAGMIDVRVVIRKDFLGWMETIIVPHSDKFVPGWTRGVNPTLQNISLVVGRTSKTG